MDSRIPNLRDAIRTARKPRNENYMYWRNLPIGHSQFRTKLMLKITEHTSPSDTGINTMTETAPTIGGRRIPV